MHQVEVSLPCVTPDKCLGFFSPLFCYFTTFGFDLSQVLNKACFHLPSIIWGILVINELTLRKHICSGNVISLRLMQLTVLDSTCSCCAEQWWWRRVHTVWSRDGCFGPKRSCDNLYGSILNPWFELLIFPELAWLIWSHDMLHATLPGYKVFSLNPLCLTDLRFLFPVSLRFYSESHNRFCCFWWSLAHNGVFLRFYI